MRELEFLPPWYISLGRRKRLLMLQLYACAIVVLALGMWLLLAQRNISVARGSLDTVERQLQQSKADLKSLDEQLTLKNQLSIQQQIMSRLGLPVEVSRMIAELDRIMPREMSLLDLSVDTEEQLRQGPDGKPINNNLVDRRLRVKLLAVAPTDLDLANFLAGLNNVPFFEQSAMTFSRDRTEGGHLMREFEVTFSMNLSQEIGN